MKGKKLSLKEVLNLEDGTKVWVEDNRTHFNSELCEFRIDGSILDVISDKTCYVLNNIKYYESKITFYEWIEDELTIPDQIEAPYYSHNIVNKMSVEICNLRGLDLTDDNIRLIIEEFS